MMSVPQVLCICNPLLDISAEVSLELFDKYGLKTGNAILAEPKHLPLYDELAALPLVEYIAGGAGQNTARACKWMLQDKEPVVHYVGCIGKDKFGERLRGAAETAGVRVHYLEDENTPTGTCAVLVHHRERSLVANLAAANSYKVEHLQTPAMQKVIENTQYFYISGYFLTVSIEAALLLGKHAAQYNKWVLWNISAPFVPEFFTERALQMIEYTDIVFGNETEAAALGKKLGVDTTTDLHAIARKIAEQPKANKNRTRTVIITHGAKPTVVFHEGQDLEFPVMPIAGQIIDTNGAGDSFCGGFLSQFIFGKPLAQCIAAGSYCAGEVIQQSGCKFPPTPAFTGGV